MQKLATEITINVSERPTVLSTTGYFTNSLTTSVKSKKIYNKSQVQVSDK